MLEPAHDEQSEQDGLRAAASEPDRLVFHSRALLGRPQRLEIDEMGLVEIGPGWRRTGWHEVYGVRWQRHRVVVYLLGRRLRIDRRYGDWKRIGREIEDRAVLLHQRPEPIEVAPEQIAAWLDVPVDGALVTRLGRRRAWGVVALAAGLALMAWSLRTLGAAGMFSAWFQLLVIGAVLLSSADRVQADVQGISLRVRGRPRTFAWSEIQRMSEGGQHVRVYTDRGAFTLARKLPRSEYLFAALRHVIAARNAGATLPSDRPISETAISRAADAGPDAGSIERGLSR